MTKEDLVIVYAGRDKTTGNFHISFWRRQSNVFRVDPNRDKLNLVWCNRGTSPEELLDSAQAEIDKTKISFDVPIVDTIRQVGGIEQKADAFNDVLLLRPPR